MVLSFGSSSSLKGFAFNVGVIPTCLQYEIIIWHHTTTRLFALQVNRQVDNKDICCESNCEIIPELLVSPWFVVLAKHPTSIAERLSREVAPCLMPRLNYSDVPLFDKLNAKPHALQ